MQVCGAFHRAKAETIAISDTGGYYSSLGKKRRRRRVSVLNFEFCIFTSLWPGTVEVFHRAKAETIAISDRGRYYSSFGKKRRRGISVLNFEFCIFTSLWAGTDEVSQRAEEEKLLLNILKTRRHSWIGHTIRHNDFSFMVPCTRHNEFVVNILEGAISGKKAVGRPRLPETQELTVTQQ